MSRNWETVMQKYFPLCGYNLGDKSVNFNGIDLIFQYEFYYYRSYYYNKLNIIHFSL